MYDAIIVGARVAGAPTAMLLARRGYRVLLVDRDSFPSDVMSTHLVLNSGVAKLSGWGLLDKVASTNCPPIDRITMELGPIVISGTPTPVDGIAEAYCPRRRLLDSILVDAALEAGAEFREGFAVHELTSDGGTVTGIRGRSGGGNPVEEQARIVIGADGVHSTIAKLVGAPEYHAVPARSCGYYSYFSGIPIEAATVYNLGQVVLFSFPTNDGLTCLAAEWPHSRFHEIRDDIEGAFNRALQTVPALAERAPAAKREERWNGTGQFPNFFRKPYGQGWALVGDAGYHKDPVTGRGISDSFRDAELLAGAIDDGFSGRRPLDETLAGYEQLRNQDSMPVYELTLQQVTWEPPTAETMAFMAAIARSPIESSRFLGLVAGGTQVADFMSPENIQRIMAGTQAAGAGS